MEVRKAYIMEKEYSESNMSFFIVALYIDYIPTKRRKLSGTRQKLDRQVHVLAGDRQRGWDGMIRLEIFKSIDQVHVRAGDG